MNGVDELAEFVELLLLLLLFTWNPVCLWNILESGGVFLEKEEEEEEDVEEEIEVETTALLPGLFVGAGL